MPKSALQKDRLNFFFLSRNVQIIWDKSFAEHSKKRDIRMTTLGEIFEY